MTFIKKRKPGIKYQFSTTGILMYYGMLVLMLYGYWGRIKPQAQIGWLRRMNVYSHVSNFVISYTLVSVMALILLLNQQGWKLIIWFTCLGIMANVFIERYVTLANVPDVWDAVSGGFGCVLALGVAWLMKRYGLTEVPLER